MRAPTSSRQPKIPYDVLLINSLSKNPERFWRVLPRIPRRHSAGYFGIWQRGSADCPNYKKVPQSSLQSSERALGDCDHQRPKWIRSATCGLSTCSSFFLLLPCRVTNAKDNTAADNLSALPSVSLHFALLHPPGYAQRTTKPFCCRSQ